MGFVEWMIGCAPEIERVDVTVRLEPLGRALDFDQDGVTDADEVRVGTDPRAPDSDTDGLFDGEELVLGADPTLPDTDLGGAWDGDEILAGTAVDDPLDDDVVGLFVGGGSCSHAPAHWLWWIGICWLVRMRR